MFYRISDYKTKELKWLACQETTPSVLLATPNPQNVLDTFTSHLVSRGTIYLWPRCVCCQVIQTCSRLFWYWLVLLWCKVFILKLHWFLFSLFRCRLECLENSGLSMTRSDTKVLCREDSVCGTCWSMCWLRPGSRLSDDDNVRISNDVTDTSVRVNRCRVSWHFETGTSPDNVPSAAIYQLYGLDLAGKWFDLNQWTLPVIDMPHHIIAKVSTMDIRQASTYSNHLN